MNPIGFHNRSTPVIAPKLQSSLGRTPQRILRPLIPTSTSPIQLSESQGKEGPSPSAVLKASYNSILSSVSDLLYHNSATPSFKERISGSIEAIERAASGFFIHISRSGGFQVSITRHSPIPSLLLPPTLRGISAPFLQYYVQLHQVIQKVRSEGPSLLAASSDAHINEVISAIQAIQAESDKDIHNKVQQVCNDLLKQASDVQSSLASFMSTPQTDDTTRIQIASIRSFSRSLSSSLAGEISSLGGVSTEADKAHLQILGICSDIISEVTAYSLFPNDSISIGKALDDFDNKIKVFAENIQLSHIFEAKTESPEVGENLPIRDLIEQGFNTLSISFVDRKYLEYFFSSLKARVAELEEKDQQNIKKVSEMSHQLALSQSAYDKLQEMQKKCAQLQNSQDSMSQTLKEKMAANQSYNENQSRAVKEAVNDASNKIRGFLGDPALKPIDYGAAIQALDASVERLIKWKCPKCEEMSGVEKLLREICGKEDNLSEPISNLTEEFINERNKLIEDLKAENSELKSREAEAENCLLLIMESLKIEPNPSVPFLKFASDSINRRVEELKGGFAESVEASLKEITGLPSQSEKVDESVKKLLKALKEKSKS